MVSGKEIRPFDSPGECLFLSDEHAEVGIREDTRKPEVTCGSKKDERSEEAGD